MLNPQKTIEREALLNRLQAAYAEFTQYERNLVECEARLPLEEQLRLYLLRLTDSNLPELAAELDRRCSVLCGFRLEWHMPCCAHRNGWGTALRSL